MTNFDRQRLLVAVRRLQENSLGRPDVEWANATIYPIAFRHRWPAGDNGLATALRAAPADAHAAVYVHIPFCNRRCRYCVYMSVRGESTRQLEFCKAVARELNTISGHLDTPREIRKLYFGGGTPTALEPSIMEEVFDAVGERFTLSPDAGWTVETSPQRVSAQMLTMMKRRGVNIICMGIQSLDDGVLSAAGRAHDSATAKDAVEAILGAGFDLLNVDLMVGLPGQTEASVRRTVQQAVSLAIPEFSVYYLRCGPEGGMHKQPHSFREEILQFAAAVETFAEAGYVRVRPHHFVHPDKVGLWRRYRSVATPEEGVGDESILALGLGPSAFGRVGNLFYGNSGRLADYEGRVEAAQLPVSSEYRLGDEDHRTRFLIGRLGQKGALELGPFQERFGEVPQHLAKALALFETCGLVARDGTGWSVTESGTLFYDCFERACYPDRWREELW